MLGGDGHLRKLLRGDDGGGADLDESVGHEGIPDPALELGQVVPGGGGDHVGDGRVVGGLGLRHELGELPVALRRILEVQVGIVLVAVLHQVLDLGVRESCHL